MTEASVWLREAIATLDRPAPLHPYQGSIARAGLDALARVAAQTADLASARTALAQADALAGPAMRLFDTWPGPVHAWIAAARGEVPAAVELALGAADEARRRGQAGCELIALHDMARIGAPARVIRRLAELATVVQGELASLFIGHVQALVAANGTRPRRGRRVVRRAGSEPARRRGGDRGSRRAPAGGLHRQRRGVPPPGWPR